MTKLSAKIELVFLIVAVLLLGTGANAQRQMEKLGRGVVAVPTNTTTVYIGWRMLGTDPDNIAFNLYRSTDGGAPVQLTTNQTQTTDFVDASADLTRTNSYFVRPVLDGVEQAASGAYVLPGYAPVQPFITVPIQPPPILPTANGDTNYTYSANDCSVGDLDGDGEYEIVLKWDPSNSQDNSYSGFTGPVYIDAYKLNGTLLWRINLGLNIRAGAHYTQFMVYDLDGDGKAEVACKTAPGTIDGQGNYVLMPGDDPSVVYTNSSGYILSGPEYLTIFNGQTGAAMVTTNYVPARGDVCDWGDNYGNRVDRFLACVAYLDGQRPSLVMCRGYYGPENNTNCVVQRAKNYLVAWNWRNGILTNLWTFEAAVGQDGNINSNYVGQGNHNLCVADVNGDGYDEIVYGACTIDHNGTGLYTTGLGHGDAVHCGKMDPDRPGLLVWDVHETPSDYSGGELHDAATGQILWGLPATGDTGRGLAAHIDPRYRGYQMWSSSSAGTYNKDGTLISPVTPKINFAVWWDAGLERLELDCSDGAGQNPILNKWNGNGETRVLTLYNYPTAYGCKANNGTKANPCLSGDILGDWREEMIYRATDSTKLYIFTTTTPATNRFYTFMHDPQYRLGIAWQNVGYNQPPDPSFYIGEGMAEPPIPPVSDANLVWCGGIAANAWDVTTTTNWYVNWQLSGIWTSNTAAVFNQGNSVLFDLSGSNDVPVNLVGTLMPGKVTIYSPKDYVFGGSGSLAGTTTVVKAGTGTLTIHTTNSYSGATIVADGTLILDGSFDQSPVTIRSRGTLQIGTGGTSGALGTNNVVNNGMLVFNRSDAITNGAAISGSGGLTKLAGGTLILTGTNTYGGLTTISNGTLQIGAGGTTGTLGATNVVNIGTLTFNRSDAITNGIVISGSGGLIQLGSGTLTLTRNNTFSGGTAISNGTLLVNNTTGSGTGTGAVTVASTGTLGGTGVVPGPVTVNGTLAPGSPDTGVGAGTLTISNDLVVNSGATLSYALGTTSDRTVVSGNLTLCGTLNITDAGGFTNGTYTLFSYGGMLSTNGTPTILAIGTTPNTNLLYLVDITTGGQVNLVVASPPVASFTASPTNGVAPLAVTFIDGSSGTITNRHWDFGNGDTTNTTATSLSYTYGTSGTYTVRLTAWAYGGSSTSTRSNYIVAVNAPHLVVVPGSLNYGSVAVGQTKNLNFSVINTGDLTLTGTAVSAAAPFAVTSPPGGGYNVGAGQTATVTVAFSPSASGTFNGSVVFASNGGNSTNAVSGVGLTPGNIAVTPDSWDFGWVAAGTTAQTSFVVINFGGTTVSNGTATVTGGPFSIVSGATFSVPGFGTANVVVQFAPVTAGGFTNSVVFATANGGAATNTVRGTGAIVPVASFSASRTNGPAPLAVTFTDTSTGTITNRFWNFGDGSTTNTTATSLTHTYSAAGTYTVSLTVSGPLGSSTLTLTNYIVAGVPPVADFSANPTNGLVPLLVNFTDASTGGITNRLWSFGDGGTSSDTNPSHTYVNAGTYSVSLTAAGPCGTDTKTQTNLITVSALSATWTNANASGNWSEASNWDPVAIPDYRYNAIFGTAGTTSVVDSVSRTVGTITFDRAANFFVSASGGANLTINHGLTVTTNFTYTISAPIVLGAANLWSVTTRGTVRVSGTVSGTNSIIKTGSGTLILSGTNTYDGGTTVSNGTLLVNNTGGSGTGTGLLSVASGATLGGPGVIGGPVVIANGGLLSPGSPDTGVGVGTLTISNNLAVGNTAVLEYELGTNSDLTVVSSNLTLAGTLNITDAGGFTNGTYTLFRYGGTLTTNGSAAILTIGSVPDTHWIYTVDISAAGYVKLTAKAPPPVITTGLTVTNALLQVGSVAVVVAGDTNVFSVEATDPDPLSYQWSFGDGVTNAWSASSAAEHAYTNCGPYDASVTVSNEWAATSSNFTVAVACQLDITKLQAKLNFARTNADSCTVQGRFDLPAKCSFSNKLATLDIGGAKLSFGLDSKGRGRNGLSTFSKPTYNKKTGRWTLKATLKNGSWQTAWADYSMINSNIPRPVVVTNFPVILVLDTEAFMGTTNLHYTATQGKSGTAK